MILCYLLFSAMVHAASAISPPPWDITLQDISFFTPPTFSFRCINGVFALTVNVIDLPPEAQDWKSLGSLKTIHKHTKTLAKSKNLSLRKEALQKHPQGNLGQLVLEWIFAADISEKFIRFSAKHIQTKKNYPAAKAHSLFKQCKQFLSQSPPMPYPENWHISVISSENNLVFCCQKNELSLIASFLYNDTTRSRLNVLNQILEQTGSMPSFSMALLRWATEILPSSSLVLKGTQREKKVSLAQTTAWWDSCQADIKSFSGPFQIQGTNMCGCLDIPLPSDIQY